MSAYEPWDTIELYDKNWKAMEIHTGFDYINAYSVTSIMLTVQERHTENNQLE